MNALHYIDAEVIGRVIEDRDFEAVIHNGGTSRLVVHRAQPTDPVLYGPAPCNALVGYRGRIYSQDHELRMEVQQFLENPLTGHAGSLWTNYEDGV